MGSDPKNIQYGGGFRMHVKKKMDVGWHELGHFADLSVKPEVTTKELTGSRTAARGTVKTSPDTQKIGLSCTALELSIQNLIIALMSEGFQDDNQVAGYHALAQLTVVEDLYVRLGKNDISLTKILVGTITGGPYEIGETVTGGTSSATGTVAWTATGLLELVNVTGTFVAGETVTGGTSSASSTSASVQIVKDLVVVDSATPTIRYVAGTDYDLLPDEGMFRVHSAGSISGNPYVAYNYPALSAQKANFLDGGIANREVLIVSDKDNNGPRYELYYPSVDIIMSGDWTLLTDDASGLPLQGTVLEDSTQTAGGEYGTIKMMAAA
jgi:hypothetical protein